jgi:iron transport multicopper oxidase
MRFSVVVTADQAVDNYWIHTPMSARAPTPTPPNWATDSVNVNAVLHYDGAPATEPTSAPPTTITGTKLQEHLLVPSVNIPVPGQAFIGGADRVFNLTFEGHSDASGWAFYLNCTRFNPSTNPSVPTLLRILSGGAREDEDFPAQEHTRTIKRGQTVEISIVGRPGHPFHLHGHTFHVVKGATGPANFVNPPRRDVTPTGAQPVVIRFVADNPGPWILHCHIDLHLEAGLAMVFAEDTEGIAQNIQPSAEWQQLCTTYNALDPALQ